MTCFGDCLGPRLLDSEIRLNLYLIPLSKCMCIQVYLLTMLCQTQKLFLTVNFIQKRLNGSAFVRLKVILKCEYSLLVFFKLLY